VDVAVHAFDPEVSAELAKDERALNKKRIRPDIRAVESRYVATTLPGTLETCGQWGAVRVLPRMISSSTSKYQAKSSN
jgi:hypothetical protein